MTSVNAVPLALTFGAVTFLLAVIWGAPLVEVLRRLKIGMKLHVDGPNWHGGKAGTPTMGGLLIVIPAFLITVMANFVNLIRPNSAGTGVSILVPLFVLMGFAVIGAVDDVVKVRTQGEGISARAKLLAQIVLAAITAGVVSLARGSGFQYANEIFLPILGFSVGVSPIIYILLMIFVIVGMSNAVNLTDGMDGLAGTVTASAFAAYGLIALLQGQIFLVQFCFIMVGACFAFLWYNAFPAQMIMGDTGSLALGATLATVAFMTGQWLLLPIIAIVPVAETISVILQVFYARWTDGEKLFLRSPLHFHFELVGWSETQVVQRFFLTAILAAMVGVALALVR
jgi:phospho-N-acetylmuramoyl-pentapeptide-transferase